MDGLIRISKCSDEAFSVFDGSQVVVTPELVLFWKPPNPFGQWTESPFEIDGVTYNCAEQYMMAEKAYVPDSCSFIPRAQNAFPEGTLSD